MVLIALVPLWGELRVEGEPLWNAFLFLLLSGVLVGTMLLHAFLLRNINEVLEVRFETRDQ
jgi:hypothetical protein